MANFPYDFPYSAPIPINNASVSGTCTDFPMLVDHHVIGTAINGPFDADGLYPAQNGGGDLRFSSDSAGATQLACEVASFVTNTNPALGTAQIWVKVPTVDTGSRKIYIWWGNGTATQPAVTDTYGRNAVWSNGYVHVHHFEEASGTLYNSTGDATYDGTGSSISYSQTGLFSKCVLFIAGNNSGVALGADSISNTNDITFEVWFNSSNYSVGKGLSRLISDEDDYNHGNHVKILASGPNFTYGQPGGENVNSAQIPAEGNWIYGVCTRPSTGNGVIMYVAGLQSGTGSIGTWVAGSQNTTYGKLAGGDTSRSYTGLIEEPRILNRIVSPEEVFTKYNNQSAPGTFATMGSITVNAGAIGSTIRKILNVDRLNIKKFNGVPIQQIKKFNTTTN